MYNKSSPGWLALSGCTMLCSQVDLKHDPADLSKPALQHDCNGDSSESALL